MTVTSKATRHSMRTIAFLCFVLASLSPIRATGRTVDAATAKSQPQSNAAEGPLGSDLPPVAIQPLAQQVRRLESALDFLGQPLSQGTQDAIRTRRSGPQLHKARWSSHLLGVAGRTEGRT